MASRTVSVELQAKVAGYITPVEASEKATKGLKDEIVDMGVESKREFDKMEKSAVTLAVAIKETGHETDAAGTQMKETAVDAGFLASELKKARTAALEAAAAFTVTGERADLLRYKQAARYVSDLERLAKQVSGAGGAAEGVGQSTGQAVSKGFDAALKGPKGLWQVMGSILTNPIGLLATLAVVALVGAEIGGALGGAIIAGLGVSGIGAGVAAALGDPSVKQATGGLKATLHEIAIDVRNDFAGPTSDAVRILRDEFNHLRPSINATASELAPMTALLAKGAASGLDIFWGHLSKALLNSKPLIEWTARELPKLADDVGGLLEEMSKHTDEAEFALDALFGILKVGIGVLKVFTVVGAGVIDVLQGMEHAAAHIPVLGDAFDKAGKHGQLLKLATDEVAGSAEQLAKREQELAAAVDANTAAFERSIREMLAADNAAIEYQQSIDDLTQSVHENGVTLDITTQKGRNNKRMLDQLVGSIEATYEENIKLGKGTHEANLAFLAQEGALQRQLKALGFSKAAIDDYIGRLEALRYAAIAANNAINDTGVGYTHHDSYATGGYRHAAAGMFVPPSNPGTLIGEPQTAGEWLIPQAGISHARAGMLLAGAARPWGMTVGASGGGPSTLQLAATFVLPSGEVSHRQLITYALNTGRQPADLFPASSR